MLIVAYLLIAQRAATMAESHRMLSDPLGFTIFLCILLVGLAGLTKMLK